MIWLALLACSLPSVIAGDINNFIFPSNLTLPGVVQGSFAIGTTIEIQWETIWEKATLVLYQANTTYPLQLLPNTGMSTLHDLFRSY